MSDPGRDTVAAVVLAGGRSRRFGTDKLAHPWHGTTLLAHLVDTLPETWPVVVVGPRRPLDRPVTFAREEPPGSGPAAAWLAGVRAAVALGADRVVCLPGDAPYGARAATVLAHALDDAECCVGSSPDRVRQPLHVGLRGATLTAFAATPAAELVNASARRVVAELAPVEVDLAQAWLRDVDTPADLSALPAGPD